MVVFEDLVRYFFADGVLNYREKLGVAAIVVGLAHVWAFDRYCGRDFDVGQYRVSSNDFSGFKTISCYLIYKCYSRRFFISVFVCC